MADRMLELAAKQPGFLGVESARGGDGLGLTVSYWRDEASIFAWKRDAEHQQAQHAGRHRWYADYEVRIAKVERAYGKP
jgi:heme-degrading monooxygenase HmoA